MMADFYSEEIEVHFDREPLMEKKPGLPSAFTWRGREYEIVELLKEWHDYRVRGKPKCRYEKERGSYWVTSAEKKGSWGVGRDYYRVRTQTGEVFESTTTGLPSKGGRGVGCCIGRWRRGNDGESQNRI